MESFTQNTFYVYSITKKQFVKINTKTLKISLKPSLSDCAFWTNKKQALSWKSSIQKKFPDAQLIEAVLALKSK